MAYMVFIHTKAAAGRHSPPTAITNTTLSASDCGSCALVVLTACHLGAMYAHLQQKRSSQQPVQPLYIAHRHSPALPLPLCLAGESDCGKGTGEAMGMELQEVGGHASP
jgi:hypothetical protein